MNRQRPNFRWRLYSLFFTILVLMVCVITPSCGTIRTHAGIEHESYYDLGDYGHYRGKKHYKKHHKKHKKHHRHHHHDHDDDDDDD